MQNYNETVCQNIDLTPWQKLKHLCWNNWRNWYDVSHEISNNYINCPYCGQQVIPEDVEEDSAICELSIGNNNELWYNIIMPCCKEEVYTTQVWNTSHEYELLQITRQNYEEIYKLKQRSYEAAKRRYNTICDLIFDKYGK